MFCYFLKNLTAVNIVFKPSSGFRFINHLNKTFDFWTQKTHEGNACWNSHSSCWETIPFLALK